MYTARLTAIGVIMCGLFACAMSSEIGARRIIQLRGPSGDIVYVAEPRPDVLRSGAAAQVKAEIPTIREVLESSFSVDEKFERIRAEIPDIDLLDVLEYHLAIDYANGLLSKKAFNEFSKNIYGRFLNEIGRRTSPQPRTP